MRKVARRKKDEESQGGQGKGSALRAHGSADPPQTNRAMLCFLLGLSSLFVLIGVILCPSLDEMIKGIKNILLHPAMVDFDSFYWAGNMGSPFVQAGLCVLMVTLLYWRTGTDIQGIQMAAALMVAGFSFYGKTIVNMCFPMAGVFLYGLLTHKKPKELSALAVFCTCLGPVFSTLAFFTEPLGIGSPVAAAVGAVGAVFAGGLAAFFASFFPKLHGGMLLYNAGLAAGWVATLLNALIKAVGLSHDAYPYSQSTYIAGQNGLLAPLLLLVFAYFIVFGLFLKGGAQCFELLWSRASNTDHTKKNGFGACMIAMGISGALAVLYVLLIGGEINGTIFPCAFAAAGFIIAGSTLRSHMAVSLGVIMGALCTGGIGGVIGGGSFRSAALLKLSSRPMILATLFACGIAPVAGAWGDAAGMVIGFAHSLLIPSVSILHGWMSLYNNAFSLGILSVFMRPVYERMRRGRR